MRGIKAWGSAATVLVAGGFALAAPAAQAASIAPKAAATVTGADYTFPASQTGLADVAKSIRADVAYQQGFTGKGVGVALIDTGVVPVLGLTSGNVVNGPDLSVESQVPSLIHRDGYGHGTHMAGIIAGRDATDGTGFRGIAPDSKLTSIKVGSSNGAVDVSQMLAAIDWVVKHRNDDPANPIKVLNLSYGTDSTLGRATNPLAFAVQNAWDAGIAVVVASGNSGSKITMPATDIHPIVVGSVDPNGTTNPSDDTLSDFTSTVSTDTQVTRTVDTLVPGRSIASLRDPGGYADTYYPTARVGDRYFKGSGTSQAAAVVSGALALILQKYPTLTPWGLSFALRGASPKLVGAGTVSYGELNLASIFNAAPTGMVAAVLPATGTGSLQASRGTSLLYLGNTGTPLTGERDLFGPFSTTAWAKASAAQTSWNGGDWMGHPWTGTGWAAASDGQANWSGRAWSGTNWSGRAWSDISWSGRAWSGRAWSGTSFSGAAWSGVGWSGASWK
ncbi:MAG: serine protease AprX [Cryptosporangiaceae bacterium]|nr:serine protease AprX [Cryptosporangiaceae bacterium]